jgi:hypothetical protein
MMKLGDIAVVPAGTVNPYFDLSIIGKKRSDLLECFFKQLETPGFEFWHAPVVGDAKKLNTAAEANVDPVVIEYYWGVGAKRR